MNKVVSIEAFRAMKLVDRTTILEHRQADGRRQELSRRSIAHRERMLRFLRTAAAERRARALPPAIHNAQEVQGRLLL